MTFTFISLGYVSWSPFANNLCLIKFKQLIKIKMTDGQGQPGQFQMPQDPAFQFNDIMQKLTNATQNLIAEGIPNLIARFNGTRENLFKWLKSIEEHAIVVYVSDNQRNCKYGAVKLLDVSTKC